MKQKSYKKNLDGSGRTRNDRAFVGVLGEHGERLRGRNLGEREKREREIRCGARKEADDEESS